MKVAVIGLGSMGRRRVRNLRALGIGDIAGVDARADRRKEAAAALSITVVDSLEKLPPVQAVVICTPPALHARGLAWSVARSLPTFVELNVVPRGLKRLDKAARAARVLVAPSCTFLFHPAIRYFREAVRSGRYGRVTNFSYHVGQYLPDWHPWERPHEFFVGRRETSGCRELLAFELGWMSHLLGLPEKIQIMKRKAVGFGFSFEDVYGIQLGFPRCLGAVMIDVVSRFATRRLTLNFEKAQLRWDWETPEVRIFSAGKGPWTRKRFARSPAAKGYNSSISEEMYVNELRAFLDAMTGKSLFPSSLKHDMAVLDLIERGAARA